jgi:hypothetical protein
MTAPCGAGMIGFGLSSGTVFSFVRFLPYFAGEIWTSSDPAAVLCTPSKIDGHSNTKLCSNRLTLLLLYNYAILSSPLLSSALPSHAKPSQRNSSCSGQRGRSSTTRVLPR